MKPLSTWAANSQAELKTLDPLAVLSVPLNLSLYLTSDSLWIVKKWPDDTSIGFRAAFVASGTPVIETLQEGKDAAQVTLSSSSMDFIIDISYSLETFSLHYKVTATPKATLFIPYWPKDILSFNASFGIKQEGQIHTHQRGTRSGIIFFNDGDAGSVFYFQNLTSLNAYCQDAACSAGETVGGEWPEIGFHLPASKSPLEKGKSYTVSDAIIRFDKEKPEQPADIAKAYLNHFAETYLHLSRPERFYHDWLDTVEKGLNDLMYHKGCWTYASGHAYLNAYVADYKSPPEVMVQLAVLLPMLDYLDWKGETNHRLADDLFAGLENFYQEDMKTIVRWLPGLESNLDHSEEQKKPRVMDAWYLHHPLMNLARLTDRGNEEAKTLLLNSVGFAMNVARHFKYEWPVFYQMDTLKVIKAETEEGAGGEKDVPGTYADLMLRMWRITGKHVYFEEAIKAAKKLEGLSFDIFYQANNTAFAAGAMLRLYKETKDDKYLDLSYVCLASLFDNMQLWECDYGFAEHYTTFFGMFPLKDAPYTAAYEEQEVYAAFNDYLQEAEGVEILPAIRLLIAEFIRHMIGRVAYYYPPMLDKACIAEEVKTGEIDPSLWIALEDLHDGWEPSGSVGQEVYGAGIAFGVIPNQYHKVKDEPFLLFCDYPLSKFSKRGRTIYLRTAGDSRLSCRMIILLKNTPKNYRFEVFKENEPIRPLKQNKDWIEFNIEGNRSIKLNWMYPNKNLKE